MKDFKTGHKLYKSAFRLYKWWFMNHTEYVAEVTSIDKSGIEGRLQDFS